MERIPLKIENPEGLHDRYYIQKIIGIEALVPHESVSQYRQGSTWQRINTKEDLDALGPDTPIRYMYAEVDDVAEYFILRLDDNAKNPGHLKACRIAIQAYADAIEPFIPQLAKDLRERYPIK